ncbi:MdtA/MuxA family multidrug efflux RND transporter periplasmic adaptor subunit [Roseateles amylovorans]|uniref:MdtA/MuxA family multidrug efflux RND transporter periplasmic adaptor subunit n=1 Tax=Roseateles amylovorans TaxID=2978473 RepID=A0ABY6AXN1_9BURK|nr:MdtA/MuxA family multidrug efflux RND transporter periplasmic adaptor subunit [Roseateles amylovorans]UXH77936.1 MdtA/MuxA family multidrug efflux RND transporter periplasmic adaptor subunit [Roseateles amylovorans]
MNTNKITSRSTAASLPLPSLRRTDVPAQARRDQHEAGKATPWILALVVLAAAGGGWWWWKSRQAAELAGGGVPRPASQASGVGGPGAPGTLGAGGPGGNRRFANRVQPVSVAQARLQDIRQTASAIGTISASNTAVVRAQVSGVLQAIHFKEGQQVKAGQPLAQIDPRAFQATLGQAEGQLARDKATLDNARIDLTRYKDLVAKDAVARQQLDTQEALVRQLEGTVKADQATVDSARLQLTYTRVIAPISGRVGLKQADIGNVVQTSDTNGVVSITQTRPIALTFAVPSALLPQISASLRGNAPMTVEAWSRDGKTRLATGKVATTDNAIDVSTDTIKLKALFQNDDDALFPNQSVSVRLQLATLDRQLSVPAAAVLRGSQGFYVYVVNDDSSVATRVVTPGAVDGDWMAITGPVKAGERVVIDGVDRLREGAKVEVIAADPKQRAGANAPAGRRGRGASAPGAGASGGGN